MATKHQHQETPEGFSFSPNGVIFILNACGLFAIFMWLYGTSDVNEWVQTMPTVSLIVVISHLSSVILQVWAGRGNTPSIFVPQAGLLCVALTSVVMLYAFASTEGAMETATLKQWLAWAGSIVAFAVAGAIGWRRLARGVGTAIRRVNPTRPPQQ